MTTAESSPKPKKKSKMPYGAIAWGAVGAAALVRAFWNPNRAIVKDGFAGQCEGAQGCSPYLTVDASSGDGSVLSAARGLVVKATANSVWIIPNREAVVLEYTSPDIQVMVREGQTVWTGQQIAAARQLKFAVFRIDRKAGGSVSYTPLSPSAWLASRGLRISAKRHSISAEGDNWCEGGRKLQIPERVGQCGLRLPEPSAVALLPVSVTMG